LPFPLPGADNSVVAGFLDNCRTNEHLDHTTAGDLANALDRVARGPFDLLISDLSLPDRSGLELIRELRSSGSTLPAIALSGSGSQSDLQQGREAGFNPHVVEPLNPPTLFEVRERVPAGCIFDSVADRRLDRERRSGTAES
jgi:CheY-like chemotaxis protein